MESRETSFKELDLKFFFVVKDGLGDIENVSEDMSMAYMNIRDYVDEKNCLNWIKEESVMDFTIGKLTKKNIFVLDSFDGRAFEFLQKTKALIIGPRCMLSCLMENSSVPLGTSPVFTIAMRNLVVCVSGLPMQEKNKIRDLVQWMGGYYSHSLDRSCTHLVASTIKSDKYEQAALNNIRIMHSDWVFDVWTRSKRENISANSKEFDKHKLPIFYSLNITTSGLTNARRNDLIKLITENGGNYVGSFKSSQTDILIIEKDNTDSHKYQAAIRFKKDCLIPEWIVDSVSKGYALPTLHYIVVNLKVSTPTKYEQSLSATDFNPDCTQLSDISRLESVRPDATINETVASIASVASSKRSISSVSQRKAYKDCLSLISTQTAKKSGSFLDGCCIYLAGFTADEKEKLNKILNVGGAIRYDEMNEKITHCIAGEPNSNELNNINEHGVHILALEWLSECIKQKKPAQEEPFLYRTKIVSVKVPEPPSPSSKKTIQSMNHSFKKPALPKGRLDFGTATKPTTIDQLPNDFEDEQNEFLSQYSPQNVVALPPKTTLPDLQLTTMSKDGESDWQDTEMCTEDYENLNFFIGFTVYVHDHEEELYQQLVTDCENAGAKLVDKTHRGTVHYAIVSSEETTNVEAISVEAKYVVNNLWIEDAIKQNKIVDIEYFHHPIPPAADSKPLEGMIIVISVYSGNERIFIESLANILGATKYDTYAKKQRPLLICQTPEGAKYNAAVKWGYPVVSSSWLIECAVRGEKVSFHSYLIGNSVASSTQWNFSKSSSSGSSDTNKSMKVSDNAGDTTKVQDENQLEDEVFLQPKFPIKDQDLAEARFLDEINKPVNTITTPDGSTYLRHRRLSELVDSAGRRSSKGSTPPITPPPPGDLNISDFVKEISTPNREVLYNVLKEMQSKETPESQRIRKLMATPGAETKSPPTPKIPDFVTTPEVRKRRLAFLDSYYLPPSKPRRPSTPFSEIHKRFWKEALGEQYCDGANTETFSQMDDDAIPSTSAANENPTAATKRLSDFLKDRDAAKQIENDTHTPDTETEIIAPLKFDSEMIGGTEELVGWRDPSEVRPKTNSKMFGMQFSGTPRFTISANEPQRGKIIAKIKELKGEICEDLVSFDETCTHIVCERPNRGEKILSCLASGKWILGLKYIEDSLEAGHFLNEELYEWGNPKATNLEKLSYKEQSIANAAFRWRKKISKRSVGDRGGVFQGFRVILHVLKKEQFQKLITAGKGVVLDASEPYRDSKEALKATHCFVETKNPQLNQADHKVLTDSGVKVLSTSYLNMYLTSEVEPDYKQFLLSL